jgi:DNA-binding NarL/FixJ family response regulator
MLVGILITVIPAVAVGGYNVITKANEIISMYEEFNDVAGNASKALRKVESLEEKSSSQQESIIKMQERLSDTMLNAREAKTVAESTQKEVRSLARAQEVELKAMNDSVRSELNSIKNLITLIEESIVMPGNFKGADAGSDEKITITSTQAEILRMIADGLSNASIAEARGISLRAAEALVQRTFAALGVNGDPSINARVVAVRMWQQGKVVVK